MPDWPLTLPPPLRIVLLTHSVNPRGGVVHTLELAEALHAAGHAVTVVAPARAGERFFRPVACRVELARVEAASRPGVAAMVETRIAAVVAHLAALLPRRHFDMFHAQDSITGNALAELRERGAISGFIRTVHHLDDFDDARLARWQERAFTAAERVLCVSAMWRDHLRCTHGVDAVQIRNGVNPRRYQPLAQPGDADVARALGVRIGAPAVLAVGGVEERKNSVRLLQAFVALRQRHADAQLVVVGGASLLDHDAYARSFAAELARTGLTVGCGAAVHIAGPVDDCVLPALMRLVSVVAMPSLREGFGLVALEALASGTPVVVSNRAPFTEHFGADDVFWADPLDVGSIADALARALEAPAFELPAVCRRFDWNSSAQAHLAIYRAFAAAQRRAAAPRDTESVTCPP